MQRVFIGDIQGCAGELRALLARARERFGDDFEIWCVGDLVNRGPDSLGALETLRALHDQGRARLVLGNHDIALIACHLGLREPHRRDTIRPILAAADAAGWIDWLRRLPLVAEGALGEDAEAPFAMVHAAVHPAWDLAELVTRTRAVEARLGGSAADAREILLATRLGPATGAGERETDPDADLLDRLTCCRSLGDGEIWSSAQPGETAEAPTPWHVRWLESAHDYGVVYGHWARQRLHVADGLRGLDTGCVHNRVGDSTSLCAWLPDLPRSGGRGPLAAPDDRFWYEPAHSVYYQS